MKERRKTIIERYKQSDHFISNYSTSSAEVISYLCWWGNYCLSASF